MPLRDHFRPPLDDETQLWLSEELAVPLDLEESYEETCRILRIP